MSTFKSLLSMEATHVCDGPIMAGRWTIRCRARRRSLKGEAIAARIGWVVHPILPSTQHDGFRPYKIHVDPEITDLPARRRTEPAQEFAEAVAVSDNVHGRPVDWSLFAVYDVGGGEER